MRWSVLTALGDAYSMRPPASRISAPSPTRGDSSVVTSSVVNGNVPSIIIRAKRSNVST